MSLARNDASGLVDLDSHADTFVGGSNCVLVASTGESATVHSFSNERKPFGEIPIGTVATAWVNPSTGETFVLVFHKAPLLWESFGSFITLPESAEGAWGQGV
jgi:hypothetical protein